MIIWCSHIPRSTSVFGNNYEQYSHKKSQGVLTNHYSESALCSECAHYSVAELHPLARFGSNFTLGLLYYIFRGSHRYGRAHH